jgi:hypothetical protein
MLVMLHAQTDDLAVQNGQRRGQGGRPVALAIGRHGSPPALPQRQARRGAVQRLEVALLVDAQHQFVDSPVVEVG